ncbi:MAG: hypothetical protein ABIH50_00305 [bacterium]
MKNIILIGFIALFSFIFTSAVFADFGLSDNGFNKMICMLGCIGSDTTKLDTKTNFNEYNEIEADKFKRFGLGFEIGWPFYGLNVDYWLTQQHGLTLAYCQDSNSSSYSTSQDARTHLSLRYRYQPSGNTYFSIGLGKYTDNNYYYSSNGKVNETIYGIAVGTIKDGVSYEIGYASTVSLKGKSLSSVSFSYRLLLYI